MVELKPWWTLAPQQRVALQRAYQVELDRQPMTCDPDIKRARFTAWLAKQGVRFSSEGFHRNLHSPRAETSAESRPETRH